METKRFFIILLSSVLIFTIIAFIGSLITGYVIYRNFNSAFSRNIPLLRSIIVFSIIILISIIILRKKRITNV